MKVSRHENLGRYGALALSVWYLLISTNIAYPVLDWIAPMTKNVFPSDFPCASHDCGCKTAEQCRTQCCCFPKEIRPPVCTACTKDQPKEAYVTVRVTYLSAAQCSGQILKDGDLGSKKVEPHVFSGGAIAVLTQNENKRVFIASINPLSVFSDPPDKIPIQAS